LDRCYFRRPSPSTGSSEPGKSKKQSVKDFFVCLGLILSCLNSLMIVGVFVLSGEEKEGEEKKKKKKK
jgi:hypothetical protein